MRNRYYEPREARAARVHELFSKIAPRYDLVNDLQSFGLHRVWKRQVVRLARVGPGALALDLCCGTGDLAWALARAGAEVTALDFSQPMLEQAIAKATRHLRLPPNTPHPRFVQADAQHLTFADNSFEIVTIGYGLRNLASWEEGLGEIHRVLKPNGRAVILEFGKPANRFWRWLYFGYLKLFVPLLGKIFCGDAEAYGYILESLNHYPGQVGVAAKMRQIGFAEVAIVNVLGGVMSLNFGRKGAPAN